MKHKNANEIRENLVKSLLATYSETEDCGMIASNSFNFPVVASDGEEGWVEIVVKVTKDGGDDGYLKREQYIDKVEEKKIKAEENAKKESR